jgi:hypothetical protein
MTVNRDRLYEEVWAEPMVVVAMRYGVSANFLARVCHTLNVPHPPRGYWAKLKVGAASPKPELPAAAGGHPTEWTKGMRAVARALSPPSTPAPAPTARRGWRPARHPLVDGAADLYQRGYKSESGYLRPYKRKLADVFASAGALADALSLASEFYLTFEDRGHKVSLATDGALSGRPAVDHRAVEVKNERYPDERERWAPGQLTVVGIGPLAVGLTIYELSERIEMRYVKGAWVPAAESKPERWRTGYDRDWTTHKDRPSGRFAVRAYSPYGFAEWSQEWRDEKPGQLLKRLKRICTEVEEFAPRLAQMVEEGRKRAEEQHRKWLAEQEEAKRRREEERRAQARKQSRESLLTVISRWADVVRVQEFFTDADRRVAELSEERRAALLERLARAREVLGSLDALRYLEGWRTPEEVFVELTAKDPYNW